MLKGIIITVCISCAFYWLLAIHLIIAYVINAFHLVLLIFSRGVDAHIAYCITQLVIKCFSILSVSEQLIYKELPYTLCCLGFWDNKPIMSRGKGWIATNISPFYFLEPFRQRDTEKVNPAANEYIFIQLSGSFSFIHQEFNMALLTHCLYIRFLMMFLLHITCLIVVTPNSMLL